MSNEQFILLHLHQASAAVIFLWAWFCVFSSCVNDGILGKILFGMLGFAAFSVVLSPSIGALNSTRAAVLMDVFVGLVGIRHMWMKCFWDHIKAICNRWALCARIRGEEWKSKQQ